MRHWAKVRGLQLLFVAVFLSVWWYLTGPGGVLPLFIAPIGETFSALVDVTTKQDTWVAVWVTVSEIGIAFLLALVVGLVVGFLGSRTPFRVSVYEPVVTWGYMVPFVLFYPLLLLWIGVDEGSKVAYGVMNGVFPIALNTLKGFKSVDAGLVRAGYAFGGTRRQIEFSIKLPAALPVVLAGVRLGAALTVITVILAEMLGSRRGLGFELAQASQTLQVPASYAYIIFILAVVSVLHFAIQRIGVRR